jgi:hypothetical protein
VISGDGKTVARHSSHQDGDRLLDWPRDMVRIGESQSNIEQCALRLLEPFTERSPRQSSGSELVADVAGSNAQLESSVAE